MLNVDDQIIRIWQLRKRKKNSRSLSVPMELRFCRNVLAEGYFEFLTWMKYDWNVEQWERKIECFDVEYTYGTEYRSLTLRSVFLSRCIIPGFSYKSSKSKFHVLMMSLSFVTKLEIRNLFSFENASVVLEAYQIESLNK